MCLTQHPYPDSTPEMQRRDECLVSARFGLAVVDGRSMEPTLRFGDRLLIDYSRAPSSGCLAVVRLPHRPVAVKRIARHVGDGWWVESDNLLMGTDSRVVGLIASEDVLAVVVCRVWPWPGRPRKLAACTPRTRSRKTPRIR
jgi:hypothetical protein